MRTACALILFACSVVGCAPTPRAPTLDAASERKQLLDVERDFANDSIGRGADAAFSAFLADDAVELTGGGAPIRGRAAIVASLHSKPGDRPFTLRWTADDAAVSAGGDLGYTWGHYELSSATATKQGEPPNVTRGNYVTVWRKDVGGRWRAIVDIGTK
jgi:ketosteroid isomerase-like protein